MSRLEPGRSLLLFPTVFALAWAVIVAWFVAISSIFSDEGATLPEAFGAIGGNYLVAWIVLALISLGIRLGRRRRDHDER